MIRLVGIGLIHYHILRLSRSRTLAPIGKQASIAAPCDTDAAVLQSPRVLRPSLKTWFPKRYSTSSFRSRQDWACQTAGCNALVHRLFIFP